MFFELRTKINKKGDMSSMNSYRLVELLSFPTEAGDQSSALKQREDDAGDGNYDNYFTKGDTKLEGLNDA